MARFYPLFRGPLIEAGDKAEAETIAAQRHGADWEEVKSHLDLEQAREEREAGNRRRKPKA